MIRSIALAAILGALVAAGVLYSASEPDWRKVIAIWPGTSEPAPAAKLATEDWPICTTMGSMGSEADWGQLDPRNADIENYIGYAYRRLRHWARRCSIIRAILLNRRHRSAHEHLGELYLVLGDPAKAGQQLATLEEICLISCVETDDLKRAIAAYETLARR
jgi:hypothetical protein